MVRRKSTAKKDTSVKDQNTENAPSQRTRSQQTNTSRKISKIKVLVSREPMEMTRKMYKTIRKLQNSADLVIPRLPFSQLIREILLKYANRNTNLRIQSEALKALQESAELYLTTYFEDSYLCTMHAKRKTLMISDMQLTRRLRGRADIINH